MNANQDLTRFHFAQNQGDPSIFSVALSEIESGKKISHWIWFILPQLKSLGASKRAIYYGIQNIEEAKEYLNDQILRKNLIQIITSIEVSLKRDKTSLDSLMGSHLDASKTISCLTLFSWAGLIEGKELLQFLGTRCEKTISELENLD